MTFLALGLVENGFLLIYQNYQKVLIIYQAQDVSSDTGMDKERLFWG